MVEKCFGKSMNLTCCDGGCVREWGVCNWTTMTLSGASRFAHNMESIGTQKIILSYTKTIQSVINFNK